MHLARRFLRPFSCPEARRKTPWRQHKRKVFLFKGPNAMHQFLFWPGPAIFGLPRIWGVCIFVAGFQMAAAATTADALPLLELKTRIQLSVGNAGTTVIGRLDGRPVFVTHGKDLSTDSDSGRPVLEAVTLDGHTLWTHVGKPGTTGSGVYIHWIEAPELDEALISWAYGPPAKGGEGINNQGGLFRARDGRQVHRFEVGSNNPSLVLDLDNDGHSELIRCTQRSVSRLNLDDLSVDWTHTDGVLFCWSYPTAADLDGDGSSEIIWGSEYNLADGDRSTFMAVDASGKTVWRVDGIDEDLGSTPVFVADVDGDGRKELVKNGLDLCGHNGLPANHLYVFSEDGKLLRKMASHMYSTGLGDLDGDGSLEAFGVISRRDGGQRAKTLSHLRCVNLHTGALRWQLEVPRVGLPAGNALAADLTGNGKLEAILADGNPSFYGHLPGSDWGALYVVSHDGRLLQTIDLPKWAMRLMMCDVDDDGFNELTVLVEGNPASLYVYDTQAPATCAAWPLAFGNRIHWSAEHK